MAWSILSCNGDISLRYYFFAFIGKEAELVKPKSVELVLTTAYSRRMNSSAGELARDKVGKVEHCPKF